MPGKFSLYQDLTVSENLEFFANLFHTTVETNYELIKDIYIQIKPFSNRRAGQLSGGMKQKLALCCALIHKPEVLFLDEPTTGVDVVSRREFWEMLHRLKLQGITILVSTPYMDEAKLCDRIALLQKGRLMSIETPQNIVAGYAQKLYAAKAANIYKLLTDLRSHELIATAYPFGEYLHLTLKENNRNAVPELLAYSIERGNTEVEIHVVEPTIEDSFIKLMQENKEATHQPANLEAL